MYRTATAEKAAKHIATSEIRKWAHRPIFSASSSCCMYLLRRRKYNNAVKGDIITDTTLLPNFVSKFYNSTCKKKL